MSLQKAAATAHSKDMTALELAAQKSHFKAAQLLVTNGADMNAATITGYSVLYNA